MRNWVQLAALGAMLAGGGVAALIDVLQEGPEGAKSYAAFALAKTAKHGGAGVGAVVAGGGVAALIEVLQGGPGGATSYAVAALGALA